MNRYVQLCATLTQSLSPIICFDFTVSDSVNSGLYHCGLAAKGELNICSVYLFVEYLEPFFPL